MSDSLKLIDFSYRRNINRYGIECIPIDGAEDCTLAIKNISTLDKEMEPGDAVRFATVKNPGFGFGSGTLVAALSSGSYNSLYKTENRSLSSDAVNTAAFSSERSGG